MRLLFLTYYKQAPKERRGRSPDDGYDLTINVGPKVRRLPGLRRPVADPKRAHCLPVAAVGLRVAAAGPMRRAVGPVAAAVGPMLRRVAVAPVAVAAQADRRPKPGRDRKSVV